MNFEHFIDKILEKEQGYVDHPSDSGGPTNFGITLATARAYGYQGEMIDLPVGLAREIYRNRYIVKPGFDKVAAIDGEIGLELIDTGVNMGQPRAKVFFQRCLNVFNMRGSRYADVHVDGEIGPVTLEAFRAYLRWRGHKGRTVMLRALNSLQGTFYIELAEMRPKDEDFVFGQILHRVQLEEGLQP